jgi:hypothetical protein
MARTAQVSKEKRQSIITLRHEGQLIWNILRSLTVSSSVVSKTIKRSDPELPLLQRISSVELPASEIAAQINASRSSSNRHISTSTVQWRLSGSGLHGRITAKKPLHQQEEETLRNTCQETRATDIRSVEIYPFV